MANRSQYLEKLKHKQSWESVGPVSIEQIVTKTRASVLFDPTEFDLEVKDVEFDGYRIEGFFKAGTNIPHGIGMQMIFDGYHKLYEGMFVDGLWNGFGRLLYEDGHFYIGEFKNGYYHGYGKLYLNNGEVMEGGWKMSQFQGY